MWPSIRTAASRHRPPVAVTVSAMLAPRRASSRWYQYAMSMNEVKLVSSQKTTSWITFPDRTMPSIAPMKASRNEKKRGTGSSGDM
jgi:hypothetical protein